MKRPNRLALPLVAATILGIADSPAPPKGFNYDEALVPDYTLPDPLLTDAGKKVTDAATWRETRRPEILAAFESQVYGKAPAPGSPPVVEQISRDPGAIGGKATRLELRFTFPDAPGAEWYLLLHTPNKTPGPVPAFLGLSFGGNHTITDDPGIRLSTAWMRPNKTGIVDNRATEASRGASSSRWPIEMIVDRGYALATMYCGDIDPDFDDNFENGIHGALKSKPAPDEWGTISAWAWGLSRVMDYFESDGTIDEKHVAVIGHSRLGKTSLWAGASDERFAFVISNNSGCGGAALSRRAFGETVARINTSFPHWFCDNFVQYNDNEAAIPVDQHMLIALMAPRPVYVASAVEDTWADPHGEFLAALHAGPVYALFDREGLGTDTMPAVDQPVGETIGYHVRTGKHDVTDFDWTQYLDFADKHFTDK